MSSYCIKRFIKEASKTHKVLVPLVDKVTGHNFRPTHSYLRRLEGESIGEIKEALNHSNLSTTASYIDGVETNAIKNRKHMAFQKYMSDEAVKYNKKTGSGYMCEPQKEEDEDCVDYDACSICDAKRVVFDDVELVAEWMAWSKWIVTNKSRLQINNLKRWVKHWSPKLVEYNTFLALVNSKRILKNAEKISNELVLPPLD